MVSDLCSETKGFADRAWLPVMCRGELSALIDRLMSKCLWSGWNCFSPVIREWSWKKTQIEKKSLYRERRGKHWQNVVHYFVDRLLETLSHIRIRSIKSSLTCCFIKPYKSSLIIFFEQKICGKVKRGLRVMSSDVRFTS